jgi:hypothetical protein
MVVVVVGGGDRGWGQEGRGGVSGGEQSVGWGWKGGKGRRNGGCGCQGDNHAQFSHHAAHVATHATHRLALSGTWRGGGAHT